MHTRAFTNSLEEFRSFSFQPRYFFSTRILTEHVVFAFYLQQLSLREIRVLLSLTVILPHTLVFSLQTYVVNI